MAKLTLEIEDDKLKFFNDLIQNFSFVKVQSELEEDTDHQVIVNITKGVEELKLVLEGKKKSRQAKEFLNEL